MLSARDEEGLARVAREVEHAGGQAIVQRADVTVDRGPCARSSSAARGTGRLDVLVNNAGRGYYGSIVARSTPEELAGPLRAERHRAAAARAARARSSDEVRRHHRDDVVGRGRRRRHRASGPTRRQVRARGAVDGAARRARRDAACAWWWCVLVPSTRPSGDNAVTTDGHAGVRPPGASVQTPDDVADQVLQAVDHGRSVVETTAFVRLASAAARMAPGAMRWIGAIMASRGDR